MSFVLGSMIAEGAQGLLDYDKEQRGTQAKLDVEKQIAEMKIALEDKARKARSEEINTEAQSIADQRGAGLINSARSAYASGNGLSDEQNAAGIAAVDQAEQSGAYKQSPTTRDMVSARVNKGYADPIELLKLDDNRSQRAHEKDMEDSRLRDKMAQEKEYRDSLLAIREKEVDIKGKVADAKVSGAVGTSGVTGTAQAKIDLQRDKMATADWNKTLEPYRESFKKGEMDKPDMAGLSAFDTLVAHQKAQGESPSDAARAAIQLIRAAEAASKGDANARAGALDEVVKRSAVLTNVITNSDAIGDSLAAKVRDGADPNEVLQGFFKSIPGADKLGNVQGTALAKAVDEIAFKINDAAGDKPVAVDSKGMINVAKEATKKTEDAPRKASEPPKSEPPKQDFASEAKAARSAEIEKLQEQLASLEKITGPANNQTIQNKIRELKIRIEQLKKAA